MSEPYRLYGAEFSLYSGKARSYLRKKGIAFEETKASLNVYRKFIIPRTGVRYIPVIQTPDDEVIQDTTQIIDHLEQRFPERSVYPDTPRQKLVSLLLEVYGDEWLVIPAMHYRWNFPEQNEHFIYGEFGGIVAPRMPGFIRRWLGRKVGDKFRGFVPRLGITEATIPALEASYEQLLKDLDAHFERYDYLLGGRPSIADYGFIGPLYAHLYRDPAPGKLMRELAPNVVAWVERMISDEVAEGEFLPDDEIPETLLPVLKRMAAEQLPVLLDTDALLDRWVRDNPDTEQVERFIGMHKFRIGDAEGERVVLPYALWMFQRAVKYYQGLEDTQGVDQLLTDTGFGDALKTGLSHSLERRENKLYLSAEG